MVMKKTEILTKIRLLLPSHEDINWLVGSVRWPFVERQFAPKSFGNDFYVVVRL